MTDIFEPVETYTKYMDNYLNMIFDITFPIAAILRGRSFNRLVQAHFRRAAD